MSQETSKTPMIIMLPEHDKYNIRSIFMSREEANELIEKGSTESLAGFLGRAEKDTTEKDKKGNIRRAQVRGTHARRGELHPESISLSYPGLFSKGLAKIRGKRANVIAHITENKTSLTHAELNDPNSPYKVFYDDGGK